MLVCDDAPACSAHTTPQAGQDLACKVLSAHFYRDLGDDHLGRQMLLCCRWCGLTPPMATECPRCQLRTGTTTETWLGRHAQTSSPSTWCSLRGPASRWAGGCAGLHPQTLPMSVQPRKALCTWWSQHLLWVVFAGPAPSWAHVSVMDSSVFAAASSAAQIWRGLRHAATVGHKGHMLVSGRS